MLERLAEAQAARGVRRRGDAVPARALITASARPECATVVPREGGARLPLRVVLAADTAMALHARASPRRRAGKGRAA